MSGFERVSGYLAVPPSFRVHLGGLRWSATHDALVDQAGNTFALAEELTEVLDGVFSQQPVPPFAYVLVALHRMKRGLDDLAVAYGMARPGPARSRHAGRLIAELCREFPISLRPPTREDVRLALDPLRRGNLSLSSPLGSDTAISPTAVEALLDTALAKHTTETLAAWLKYGGPPPTDAGEKLAEPVEALPLRVGKLLALAAMRPRLVGAAWLTPTLDAALTFPARRPLPAARRQGGYADVTNRGQPERLLLSQFALDSDEFVRRFAERELLYFRPEEPHVPRTPHRVLILDQGVRTWGAVRLALAGCAMALLAKDAKRAGRIDLIPTSTNRPVDLDTIPPADLADVLEASDLTDTPADAIRTALARSAPELRDVIVLTHPRSAFEPGVIAALKTCPPADRAFTVAVDETGRAEIHEWGPRGPVAVRSFRVDLGGAEAASVKAAPAPRGSPLTAWAGEVEPIAFPFRPGLVAEPTVLGFDGNGEWLVTAAADGTLQALTLDGEPPEVLPRPFRDGAVMKTVEAILGVADGVAVCGRMTLTNPAATFTTAKTSSVVGDQPVILSGASDFTPTRGDWFVTVHYDRVRRTVTLHPLAPATGTVRWAVNLNRHRVGLQSVAKRLDQSTTDVHLVTHQRRVTFYRNGRIFQTEAPPHALPVVTRWSAEENVRITPCLFLDGHGFEVRHVEPAWPKHVPLTEGKPLLGGSLVEHAQLAGDVLALAASRSGERTTYVFRGPNAEKVYELPRMDVGARQTLSPDGSLLAFRKRGKVSVAETRRSAPPRAVATAARLHNGMLVHLRGHPWPVILEVGDHVHTFVVEDERLKYGYDRAPRGKRRYAPAAAIDYDPARFPLKQQARSGEWAAVFDRLGQVVLLHGGKVVAALVVRRDKAAAYGRGGIRWGDPALLGCAPSPHAERDFAELFAEATA